MKHCPSCKQDKPLDEFYVHKKSGRPYSYCKSCLSAKAKERNANLSKVDRDKRNKKAKENREKRGYKHSDHYYQTVEVGENTYTKGFEWELKRKYGLSLDEYDTLVTAQDNKCCICGDSMVPGSMCAKRRCVDHNHTTGEVRGLLCATCNIGLGKFMDSPDLLHKAF